MRYGGMKTELMLMPTPTLTAAVGGEANAATNVGAQAAWHETRTDSSGRATGGATGRAAQIPGVVCGTEGLVEGLDVIPIQRQICLGDDDRPCPFKLGHARVARCCQRARGKHWITLRRWQPCNVQVVLRGHGQPVQWAPELASRGSSVSFSSSHPSEAEVTHDDGIGARIKGLNARDIMFQRLGRSHIYGADLAAQSGGAVPAAERWQLLRVRC